jgi:transglutaminase-like putative cysteine protease
VTAQPAGPDRAPAAQAVPIQAVLIQVVLLAAATAVTTTLYGAFFAGSGYLPRLIAVAVAACALAGAATALRARPPLTVIACSAGFAATVLLAVLPGTLTAHAWWRALTGGWAVMLSLAAPAPDSPQMLMTPALVTWLVGFLAVTVALRSRSVLGPAAILVCAQVIALMFASNQPTNHLAQTCVLLVLLLVVTMARVGEPASQWPGSPFRAARLGVAFTAALTGVGLLAAVATTPLDAARRYNPRDLLTTPLRLDQTFDPLSAVREQLRLTTPRDLFTVTITGTGVAAGVSADAADAVPLIQTVALEDFDGSQWSSPDSFRVAGPVLAPGPAASGTVTLTEHVALGALTGPYLPVAGRAMRIDASLGPDALIGFDPDSGTLVADADSFDGGSYTVTAAEPPLGAAAAGALADAAAGSGTGFAPDLRLPPVPDTLSALAAQITAGAATPYAKLTALADHLRNLPVNLNAPAGDSYGSLARLLTADSPSGEAGYADQHASAFAILARIEHIPTRVVVGYRLPAPGTIQGASRSYTVTTADSYAWAQAYLQGYGWIDFDPTDTGDTVALPPSSPIPAPPSAQPSVIRSATPSAEPTEVTQSAQPEPTPVAGLRQGRRFAPVLAGIAVLALALLLCVALAATTAVRRVRRRLRRRHAEKPAVKVVGAWEEAVDRLADTGVAIRASETALDLAARAESAGSRRAPDRPTREERALALAAPFLGELATKVTEAAFRREEPRAQDVNRAWDLERQISKALYRGRRAPYRAVHWTVPVPRHRASGRRR